MVATLQAFSKNVDVSFKFAREDLNTLKMKSAFLQEKINELKKIEKDLRSDFAELKKLSKEQKKKEIKPVEKKNVVTAIKSEFSKKEKVTPTTTTVNKAELQFYDVKARKRFSSQQYKEVVKNKTLFAVAQSPYGSYECYRILKKV
jgi:cytolysin (calcineurin-like family phosphatase)